MTKLTRAAFRLLPSRWRAPVERDLLEEAARDGRRGFLRDLWLVWNAVRIAVTLRHRQSFDQADYLHRPAMNRALGSDWFRDVRLALRSFGRQPSLVAVVIISSALGITATTTVFSLAYGVWLKPLPYPQSDRLVMIRGRSPSLGPAGLSAPDIDDYRGVEGLFSDIARYSYDAGFATVAGERGRIVAYRVAPELFNVLGAAPGVGRLFGKPEAEGRTAAVILSDAFWRTRFGSDASILGKTLIMNDAAYPIVGVMPREFRFPQLLESDVWVAFGGPDTDRGRRAYRAIARLKVGVTVDGANAELAAVAAQLAQQYPKTNAGWSADATPLVDVTFGPYQSAFISLLVLASLFFVIAGINAASLLITRADARRTELALRTALGASRLRLTRQFVIEGILLATVGGLVGIGLSAACVQTLAASMPTNTPRLSDVGITAAACVLAALLSTVTAVWYALTPTIMLRRVAASDSLRSTPTMARSSGRSLGGGLIIGEVALSVMLLVGAAMMVHSFWTLIWQDRGFEPRGVLTLDVALPFPRPRYQLASSRAAAFADVVNRLQTVPGVNGVGSTTFAPGSILGTGVGVATFRASAAYDSASFTAIVHTSSPDYFRTMGMSLQRGRGFTDDDTRASRRTAVVNQTLATRLWPGENPVGRSIDLHNASPFVPGDEPFEVIGLVGDTHLRMPPAPELFVPPLGDGYVADFVIRTDGDPMSVVGKVRQAIRAADSEFAIEHVLPMKDVIGNNFGLERAQSHVAGFLAVLAVVLSATGIYGLLSHLVSQRRRELGIRLALGAKPRDLFELVAYRAVWLGSSGVVLGILVTLGAVRLLRTQVFGLAAWDPAALVASFFLLMFVAVGAAWLPARRALRTDPLTSIRQD